MLSPTEVANGVLLTHDLDNRGQGLENGCLRGQAPGCEVT